ncbi:MAG: hypothetical protein ACM3SS_00560 [Rhodospirillaceae bacterium]
MATHSQALKNRRRRQKTRKVLARAAKLEKKANKPGKGAPAPAAR